MQILTHLNDKNNPLIAKNGTKLWFYRTDVSEWWPDDYFGNIYIQEPKKRGSGMKKPQVYKKVFGGKEGNLYSGGKIVWLTDKGEVISKFPGLGKRNSDLKKAQEFKSQWYDLMPDVWQRTFDKEYKWYEERLIPDGVYEYNVWVEGSYNSHDEKLLKYVSGIQAKTPTEAKQIAINLIKTNGKTGGIHDRKLWVFKDELKTFLMRKGFVPEKAPDKMEAIGFSCRELNLKEGYEGSGMLMMLSQGFTLGR